MTRARLPGRRLAAALLAAALLGAVPAHADDGDDPLARAGEGVREMLAALQLLMASIPQYELPEVLENGDIIIRRVQPDVPAGPDDDGGIQETMI